MTHSEQSALIACHCVIAAFSPDTRFPGETVSWGLTSVTVFRALSNNRTLKSLGFLRQLR